MNAVPIASLVRPVATWNPIAKAPDDEIQYIDIGAVDNVGKCIAAPQTVLGRDAPSRARQLVSVGDVLVSTVRPGLNAVAHVTAEFDGATASTGFCVLRPEPTKLFPSYLFSWVKSPDFVSEMARRATGASYPAVSDGIVGESKIPLPPLTEQRRIAEILDRAETLRAQRRQALAQLDFLADAIFLEMFGDPVQNSKRWPNPSLGGALTFQQYGPRFYNEQYSEAGTPIVRITDLSEAGRLDFRAMPRLLVSPEELAKYRLQSGDLIFARTGATVGKVALIGADDPECIAGAYFITMRFVENIRPIYAFSVLRSPSVRLIVETRSRQAAQQNFSGPGLRELPMPVPPIALQFEFERRIAAVQEMRTSQERALTELNALFASLQHRAFRGEL